MKRRNFLASLLALPFAAKPLEALTPLQRDNSLWLKRNTEALRLYAPSGFKQSLHTTKGGVLG